MRSSASSRTGATENDAATLTGNSRPKSGDSKNQKQNQNQNQRRRAARREKPHRKVLPKLRPRHEHAPDKNHRAQRRSLARAHHLQPPGMLLHALRKAGDTVTEFILMSIIAAVTACYAAS